jgi:hypothetical protein
LLHLLRSANGTNRLQPAMQRKVEFGSAIWLIRPLSILPQRRAKGEK